MAGGGCERRCDPTATIVADLVVTRIVARHSRGRGSMRDAGA